MIQISTLPLFIALLAFQVTSPQPNALGAEPEAAKQIKLECRLLEMSSQQADIMESKILQFKDAPVSNEILNKILKGYSAKTVCRLALSLESGKRGTAGDQQNTRGDLEAEVVVSPADDSVCNINLAFRMIGIAGVDG